MFLSGVTGNCFKVEEDAILVYNHTSTNDSKSIYTIILFNFIVTILQLMIVRAFTL